MMPEKYEAYQKMEKQKMFKQQNPSVDKEAAIPTIREYKEIKSQEDYADVCKSHKVCAIGILQAVPETFEKIDEFFEQKEILSMVDQQAEIDKSPVHYSWVNATCHSEVFSYFDVVPTSLPTVVFIHVNQNKHGVMIGKFDQEAILKNEAKFKKGKLPMRDIMVEKHDVQFKDIDCS